MKAESTVLKDREIAEAGDRACANHKPCEYVRLCGLGRCVVVERAIAKAQAEKSFKAGEDQGYQNGHTAGYNAAKQEDIGVLPEHLKLARQEGRRENEV